MQGARAPQPGATNRPSPSGRIQGPLRSRPFSRHSIPQALCGPQGASSADPPQSSPRRNAPRGPAATAAGAHPDPYRTRKLSRPAPMVLQGRPCGRLGRRRPPGRVARGLGRGGANGAPGRGGPERVPLFVCGVGVSLVFAKKKGRRPPRGPGGLSRSGLLRGLRGSPAAFCMSPTRVARFRWVGVLKGVSGSTPLAFDVFAQLLAQPLPLQCFGGQISERGL